MRNYVRPQLYVESFELTQHIAGDCTIKMNLANREGPCATGTLEFGELYTQLFELEEVCKDVSQGYCYTSSTVYLATLNS